MQEHFKVQRRIEEKNIIKEHWRPHSENWSQKDNHSQSKPWPQSLQWKRFEEMKTSQCRALPFIRRGFWGALSSPEAWHLWDEIKSGCSGSASTGWWFFPPCSVKGFSCWSGPGKATRMVLVRFDLPSFQCGWKSPCVSLLGLKEPLISHHHIPGCAQGEKCPLLLELGSWRSWAWNQPSQWHQPSLKAPRFMPWLLGSGVVLFCPPSTPWQVVYGLASCNWIKNTRWSCTALITSFYSILCENLSWFCMWGHLHSLNGRFSKVFSCLQRRNTPHTIFIAHKSHAESAV